MECFSVSFWRRLGNTKCQLFSWGTKQNSRKAHKSRDRKAAASAYLRVASRKRSAKVADEGSTSTINGHETGLQKADADATALEVQLSTSSIRHEKAPQTTMTRPPSHSRNCDPFSGVATAVPETPHADC